MGAGGDGDVERRGDEDALAGEGVKTSTLTYVRRRLIGERKRAAQSGVKEGDVVDNMSWTCRQSKQSESPTRRKKERRSDEQGVNEKTRRGKQQEGQQKEAQHIFTKEIE